MAEMVHELGKDAEKLGVFISYSRDDLAFADQLDVALELAGFAPKLDRHGIHGAENWQEKLLTLIREADTVVFVLSPSSAKSDICGWEVERAVELGKRIVPVMCRPLGAVAAPQALATLNYIHFYAEEKKPGSGYRPGMADLIRALKTDLAWMRDHTRYLQRAIEWEAGGRKVNRLLSGQDIADAKAWIARQPKDAPPPTTLHLDFIKASEAHEIAETNAREQQLRERERLVQQAETDRAAREAAQKAVAKVEADRRLAQLVAQRTLMGLGIAVMLAVVATGAGWFAWNQLGIAERQTNIAKAERDRAEQNQKAADAITRVALITQSGLLSEVAKAISDQPGGGDAPLAMLVALEGMPDAESDDARQAGRPLVAETQLQLDRAYFANRERAVLPRDGAVSAVAWSPDGRLIATGSGDLIGIKGEAWIVEAASGKHLARVAHDGAVSAVVWSPDGRLIATGSLDKTARIVEALSGKELARVAHDGAVLAVAWSPDGRLIATGSFDLFGDKGETRIVEAASGKELARVAHDGAVHAVAWSPDGRLLAIGSGDLSGSKGEARIVEAVSGRELVLLAHDGKVRALAWSPNGRLLATGSEDKTARIVETASGKELARVAHDGAVLAVAWSPDGRLLAIGSGDLSGRKGEARIVEAASGKELARVVHGDQVLAVAWSPDGRLMATGSRDETARIVEALSGNEVTRVVHDDDVWAVAWSPDGQLLATGSLDKTARIVEAASGKNVARMAHDGAVLAVEWSPIGAAVGPAILTGSRDGTAREWRVFMTTQALVDAAKARAVRCLTQAQRRQYFLPVGTSLWCIERRLWPYHGDEWQVWLPKRKAWLASGRQGDPPALPEAK